MYLFLLWWFLFQLSSPFSALIKDALPACSPKVGGPINHYMTDPENQKVTPSRPEGCGAREDCVLPLGRTRSVCLESPWSSVCALDMSTLWPKAASQRASRAGTCLHSDGNRPQGVTADLLLLSDHRIVAAQGHQLVCNRIRVETQVFRL